MHDFDQVLSFLFCCSAEMIFLISPADQNHIP